MGRRMVGKYLCLLAKSALKCLQSLLFLFLLKTYWESHWLWRMLTNRSVRVKGSRDKKEVVMQSLFLPVLGIWNPLVVTSSWHRTGFSSVTGCDPDPYVLTFTNGNVNRIPSFCPAILQENSYFEESKPFNFSPLNKAQYKSILPFENLGHHA